MEITVDVDIEDILDQYDIDEIRKYVDATNRERQEDKEIIFDLFRKRTNRFPDKEAVKEVINEIIDDLW